MCGIFSIWDPCSAFEEREAQLARMGEMLQHRGPDGSGTWHPHDRALPLSLGHRRLAIRGLGEQGAQPMRSPGGTLSFNGELFGVEPLRSQLGSLGQAFRGTSDTEILLHALDRWGMPAALDHIHGQFAFLWWSERDQKLFLARDRVGIRPLYWAQRQGCLAVASEQKALLVLPWVDRSLCVEQALRFLAMGRTDDLPQETMLTGIRSLPAGHWGEWDGQQLSVRRYARIEVNPETSTSVELRNELSRAVQEQLVSDVPLGAMVSGGLDSSAVVGIADGIRIEGGVDTVLHLYAYHDDLAEQDERLFQQALLQSVRSPHEIHWVSSSPAEMLARFTSYIHHQEEPFSDVSSYAEFCIARRAKDDGVKVLLNGLGGDEVCLGYESFIGPLLVDLLLNGDFPAFIETARVTPTVRGRTGGIIWPIAAASFHALPAPVRNAISAFRNAGRAGLAWRERTSCGQEAWRKWHPHDGPNPANAAQRGAIESWCVPRFLMHSDRMCLAHGVEGRVPLLDDGVIRAGFGIKPGDRVGPTGLKAGLRKAAADVLPSLVLHRAWKLGFHAPLGKYVQGLSDPLRSGFETTCQRLGGGPRWEDLPASQQWAWGALGCYLEWVGSITPLQTSRP